MTLSLFAELDELPSVDEIKAADAVTLRPYQLESVDAVFAEWEAGNRATLICLPTGAGKSVCFSEVMRRLCAS